MQEKINALKTRLGEIDDLNAAAGVLFWDQSTYMPPGGAAARGRQLATLGRLAHEKLVAPELGRLLDDLQPYATELPPDSDEAGLLRIARREYERAVRVPPAFTAELNSHTAESYDTWAKARPNNDFAAVQPYLEKTLDLSRRLAGFFPGYDHIADPLIDYSDYGMTTAIIRPLFNALRRELVPLVEAITAHPAPDDSFLRQHYPLAEQMAFSLDIVKRFGYDFERGRQDKTHHPFAIKFSLGDVRITTRSDENWLPESIFTALHEAGHAMYEQGIDSSFENTPLADGTSSGVHESQSRLWENLVGRSRGFWEHYFPSLQATFPDQLGRTTLDDFYRAINKVEKSLIRVDADEVTYNLHVMIRFELELQLLEGTLSVADLPAAWNDRYRSDLGVSPPDDRTGVMQDVHWYGGIIGGVFQGYTLGNIMSVQFLDAAIKAHPEIPSQIADGQFETLHTWLREQIYQPGSKYTAAELIERVTGRPLTLDPYLAYLREKFGALYAL